MCPPVWFLGEILKNPQPETWQRYKYIHVFRTCIDSTVQHMKMMKDMLIDFSIWVYFIVRGHDNGQQMARYKLELLDVQVEQLMQR